MILIERLQTDFSKLFAFQDYSGLDSQISDLLRSQRGASMTSSLFVVLIALIASAQLQS